MKLLARATLAGRDVGLYMTRYASPSTPVAAVQCFRVDADGPEPYGRLTMNAEKPAVPWTICVKDYAENEALACAAMQTGVFEDLCLPSSAGFAKVQTWRIIPERCHVDALAYAVEHLRWSVTAQQAVESVARSVAAASLDPVILIVGKHTATPLSLRMNVGGDGSIAMRALDFDGHASRDLTHAEMKLEVEPALESGNFTLYIGHRPTSFEASRLPEAILAAAEIAAQDIEQSMSDLANEQRSHFEERQR